VSIDIASSPLVVVCSTGQSISTKDVVGLRALAEIALVGYPLGWGVRSLSDTALRSTGMEPRYAFEVNDTATLLDLVEAGLGVALVPEAIAGPRRSTLHVARVSGRKWYWRIVAQAVAPGPSNPAARAFWTMLAEG
jgi:DNA-binding transcriptional LysR family regulator